jgi:hypothetical protein
VSYRTLQLCSSSGAYEAIPEPKLRLDLGAARRTLEGAGRQVLDARVMLIVQGEPEITLLRDGKIVVKTRDARAATQAFLELSRLLALPSEVA